MSESAVKRSSVFAKFWRSLKAQVVSDVPLSIEFCECGCRKPECLHGHWEHCERRLSFIEKTKALAIGDK